MGVKVFSLPDEVPAPVVDYRNFDLDRVTADEEAHKAALKAHFEKLGYTGANTGQIYSEGVADGAALYMVIEAPRGTNAKHKFFLIHLPYGDGYHSRNVGFLTKSEILKRIKAEASFRALFR